MNIYVYELGAKRAPEGGSEIAGLHPEDHVRVTIVDLEALQVIRPGFEVIRL